MQGNHGVRCGKPAGLLLLLGLLGGGCDGGLAADGSPGALATRAQPIAAEQPSGVAEAVWRWYGDPDIAKSSYASPVWFMPGGGTIICSSTMIGPNLMVTAAHCGEPDSLTLSFLTYAADDNTAKRFEDFTCKVLLSTWHSSDLALYYCGPNAQGENPGDKYGYIDIESRPPAVGDAVYSIWGNPLDTPSPSQYDVRFYSRGVITSTTDSGTFTTDPAFVQVNPQTGQPDYLTSHERPIAISTDLWGNYGASGSSQLSATTHRLVVGPLSTISTPDGRGRHALSMAQYLLDGTVDGRDTLTPRVRSANISALGLNPANYAGLLDKDHDRLIDLQEDLELLRGESARGWYALEFESERRNALWTPGFATVTFDTNVRIVRVVHTRSGFEPLLSHRRLNLTPGTWRLSVMVDMASGDLPDSLWLGLQWRDATTNVVSSQGRWLVSPAGTGWGMHALEVTVPANATGIEVVVASDVHVDARLGALNVIRAGTVMNMDSADTRLHWRNDVNGARGRVVPRGVNSNTRTDWAVRVQYDATSPVGWPIRNRQFALIGGRRYRLCFDYKQESPGMGGVMRVLSTGQERVRHTFTPGTSWQHTCTPNFRVTTDDNNVQFGVSAGTGSYLVDNITVEPQRLFVNEPGIDRPGSDFSNFDLTAADPLLCEDACANASACVAYTYVAPGQQGPSARCWLKNAVPPSYPLSTCQSGYLQ